MLPVAVAVRHAEAAVVPEGVDVRVAVVDANADGFWYVDVTWGNGRKERLGPEQTEAVAQELIKAQLAAWHEGKKLFLKPPQ